MSIRYSICLLISILQLPVVYGDCFVLGVKEPNRYVFDGPTFCEKVNYPSITVRGPFQASYSVFSMVQVSGPVQFQHVSANSVVMKNKLTTEKIILEDHSQVLGNIVFDGAPGIVKINHDSVIKGKVINGKIVSI